MSQYTPSDVGGSSPACAPERASVASAGAGPSLPLGTIARFPSTALQSPIFDVSKQVHRFALQAAARALLPSERVSLCLRRPIPGRQLVDVFYAPATQSAHYGGLQVCGSVWQCSVCSSKITERRRVELSAGLSAWPGRSILCTFTLQHNLSELLPVVLAALLKSYDRLRSGRWWVDFSSSHSISGSVRSLEVTHGSSGWHPHLHVLMLLSEELRLIPFENALKERWLYLLSKSGRYASWGAGVDVRFSDADIAGYLAKLGRQSDWTVAHEVAKAPTKVGRGSGRSPLQLLADFLAGDELSGALWRDYALAFKGKKQLVWSRGLRARLGLVEVEKSDEELAEEQEEIAILLAQLTLSQWRVVLGNDARGELLELAATGDVARVLSFLKLLGGVYV